MWLNSQFRYRLSDYLTAPLVLDPLHLHSTGRGWVTFRLIDNSGQRLWFHRSGPPLGFAENTCQICFWQKVPRVARSVWSQAASQAQEQHGEASLCRLLIVQHIKTDKIRNHYWSSLRCWQNQQHLSKTIQLGRLVTPLLKCSCWGMKSQNCVAACCFPRLHQLLQLTDPITRTMKIKTKLQ